MFREKCPKQCRQVKLKGTTTKKARRKPNKQMRTAVWAIVMMQTIGLNFVPTPFPKTNA